MRVAKVSPSRLHDKLYVSLLLVNLRIWYRDLTKVFTCVSEMALRQKTVEISDEKELSRIVKVWNRDEVETGQSYKMSLGR